MTAKRMLSAVLIAAAAALACSSSSSSGDANGSCADAPDGLAFVEQQMQSKRGTMGTAANAMVASGHSSATQIGVDTLRRGGNFVDAFVATTLAEDQLLPGVTSTAGLAGFLVYFADTGLVYYVHGPLKAVATAGGTGAGGQVLVPGAVAALAFASKNYGHLALSDVVAPVAALARNGFPIDHLYADSIAANADALRTSDYGLKTFFKGNQPLVEGDLLVQPDVATTLDGIGTSGADYFYRGDWASQFVNVVNGAGGRATLDDLANVQPLVVAPLMGQYRGFDIYTSAGYSYGGASLLLSLAALEHADIASMGPFGQSAASLELLAHVHDAESTATWLHDPNVLLVPSDAQARIVASGNDVWAKVQAGTVPPPDPVAGSHSSAVVVVDAAGNIAVGTHTINAENWGLKLFAGGLPLATSASIHPEATPGALATDPLSSELVVVDHKPRLALSTFGSGLHPGDVQVLSHVLDFGMSAEDAVLAPRLGWYAYTSATTANGTTSTVDGHTHQVDERVALPVVCAARAAGVGLLQKELSGYPTGIIDTGFPVLVTIDPTPGPARLRGMTPEWLSGSAAGL